MHAYERLRANTLATIIRDTPEGFWTDVRELAKITYADAYADVATDKNVLPSQKIDDLLQRRHFRMEKLLNDLAQKHGLSCTTTAIPQNGRHHAYVYSNKVGMTQSYVSAIGMMPKPAKFRERLANAMNLPRLDLGDEPDGAFILPNVYGVIAHNPVGGRFSLDEQKLGMIQFCVPARDCKAWAAELTFAEILSAYPVRQKIASPRRSLPWKTRKDGGNTGANGNK